MQKDRLHHGMPSRSLNQLCKELQPAQAQIAGAHYRGQKARGAGASNEAHKSSAQLPAGQRCLGTKKCIKMRYASAQRAQARAHACMDSKDARVL